MYFCFKVLQNMNTIKKIYIVLLWMLSVSGFAQHTEMDSLKSVLEQTQNDTEKAHLLNKIADLYKTHNATLLEQYAQQALSVSKEAGVKNEEAIAHINLGNHGIISGNYPKALEHFTQAQFILEDLKDEKYAPDLARVYGSIGIVFSEQSSYNKALSHHLKALKIYESEKDFIRLARVYNNIGIVYKSQKENEKALDYFLKAQKLQDSLQDPNIGITTTNIGNSYLAQNKLEQALENYLLAEKQFEKTVNYRGLGELYNNLGLYYHTTKNPEKSLEYWNKAIENFGAINDKFGISDTYFHLGSLYFEQKNYPKAIEFTQKAKLLAQEILTLEMQVMTEKLLQDIYEQTGDFKQALLFGKNYSLLKDSLVSLQNIRKSIQTEMDFEFEKQHELHKKQEALLQEKAKRDRLILLLGSVFIILVLIVIFLIYNRNHIKKTLTLEKNLAEYEQKALHLQMNPHFVFNCLGSISSFIIQNGNDEALKYLSKFSKLMRLTLEYSKESLIPVDKEIEGLQNYLELEQLRFNGIFNFTITKDKNIEDDMALPPLLIQPFVENAIIHGIVPKKAQGLITIDFALSEDNLVCTVKDNGIGFKTSQERKEKSVFVHQSMALNITRKRLKMIEKTTGKKAYFTIEETLSGTEVVVVLPVQDA